MSYSAGRVDYNKAKLAAYVVVAGFLAIMFVFGVRSATGPELHDGDRVESLTCPVCEGTGDGKQAGTRCQACLGNKLLKAVVPGPKHPVDLRGTVRDSSAFKEQTEADKATAADAQNWKPSLTPVQGAVPQAQIVFEGATGRTEFTSKATGKYWGVIPPGRYKVTVRAPGYTEHEQEIEIAPRTHPIWPEAGGLDPSLSESLHLDLFLTPSKG